MNELKGVIAASVPQWISVRDRLPEMGQTILSFNKFSGVELDYFDKNGFSLPDVTHWMPLPPPPSKEG